MYKAAKYIANMHMPTVNIITLAYCIKKNDFTK